MSKRGPPPPITQAGECWEPRKQRRRLFFFFFFYYENKTSAQEKGP